MTEDKIIPSESEMLNGILNSKEDKAAENKFHQKEREFAEIMEECLKQFSIKNKSYGNDYFEGDYTELERWMSVKRKVARLQAYYSGTSKDSLPDETLIDTWKDLAIYCIMESIILKKQKEEK